MSRLPTGKIWTLALLALLATGCQKAAMEVKPSFKEQALEYRVSGRQGSKLEERIAFGPYETGKVDREWTTSSAWAFLGYLSSRNQDGFRFSTYSPPYPEWMADCRSRAKLRTLNLEGWVSDDLTLTLTRKNHFTCAFKSRGTIQIWLLTMAQSGAGEPLEGVLDSGAGKIYTVRAVNQMQGTAIRSSDAVGYSLSRGGEEVALVEVVNEGRVWIHESVGPVEAFLLASAASSLLLHEPPEMIRSLDD